MKSLFLTLYSLGLIVVSLKGQNNPFLRPGSNSPKPPVIQRPAPPPPKPIPRNPNIEFRGYYEFEGVWRVALFNKVKNQGFWLVEGEVLEGIEVESFNSDTEVIKLKGEQSLRGQKDIEIIKTAVLKEDESVGDTKNITQDSLIRDEKGRN